MRLNRSDAHAGCEPCAMNTMRSRLISDAEHLIREFDLARLGGTET